MKGRRPPVGLLLAALLGSEGCDRDDSGCTPGYEACPCTADARCLQGLQCLSDRCVDPVATGEGDSGSAGAESGAEPFDNVAACEALLDSIACTPAAGVELLDCDSLGASPCELADYFACLADNATCPGGALDVTGWGQCMDLAVCT